MRTLRVLSIIDSLGPSGAERSTLAMAQPLRAHGIEVEIAHFGHDAPALLGVSPVTLHSLAAPTRRSRLRSVRRLLEESPPDLVHTTLFESDVVGRVGARLAGVPVVSSLVNMAHGPEQRSVLRTAAWKLRSAHVVDAATAQLCVRLHAISASVAETMGRRLRVDQDRIDVVPRGRDVEALGRRSDDRRRRVRQSLGIEEKTFMVLAAGRHEPQKGLDLLVEAAADLRTRVPDVSVVVAGRFGSESDALRRIIAGHRLDETVQLLDRRDDVPDLMAAADAFVFPSRWEGFGGVLIEALALEVPIVATDIPTSREVLQMRTGVAGTLIHRRDPQAMALALQSISDDASAHAAVAARGRAHFEENFTLDRMTTGMAAFYRKALS